MTILAWKKILAGRQVAETDRKAKRNMKKKIFSRFFLFLAFYETVENGPYFEKKCLKMAKNYQKMTYLVMRPYL